VSESDATLSFEADVPAFLRDVDEMASKTESIFTRMAKKLGGMFSGMFTGGGGSFQQSPMAMTTKELEKQHKLSLEQLKVERMRRDVQRAARFDESRRKYGEDAELTWTGELRRPRRDLRFQQTIGGLASGVGMAHQFMNSGGSNAGYVQLGTSIASMLAPTFAPLIQAIGAMGVDLFKKQEHAREMALQRYQVGGEEGAFLGNKTYPLSYKMDHVRKQFGFNQGDFTKMYTGAARGGAFEGAKPEEVMYSLMNNETMYGTGSNLSRLFGAVGKSGSGGQTDAMMSAYGLAIAEGMSRGRMGEILDQLTAAVEQNTDASTDVEATANRFLFISSLGQMYRGNTASAREMDQSIRGLAKGSTPYTQVTSLFAAGFGTGSTFSQASLAAQTGVDVEGGVSSEAIIKSNFSNYIGAYARANSAGKADIIYTLSFLTDMPMPKVKKIMDRLASGPMGKITKSLAPGAPVPDYLLQPRISRAKGEDALRPDIKTQGPGDFMNSLDTSNEEALENLARMPMDEQRKLATPPGWGDLGSMRNEPSAQTTSSDFASKYVAGGEGRFGNTRPGGHFGQDLMFPPGTTVYSPCDGIVSNVAKKFSTRGAKPEPANGAMVWITSTEGTQYRLFHLDPKTLKVSQGSRVERGDEIGRTLKFATWQNGKKTHLHAEVMKNGQLVDPVSNMDMESLITPAMVEPGSGGMGPMSAGSAAPSAGAAAAGAGGGAVTVNINVSDKTTGGVNVERDAASYAKQSKMPAPGDTPAQSELADPFQ